MDEWAFRFKDHAAFICVCCRGPELAEQFGNELRLTTCTNTWVDRTGMPKWGQLGCNGFIILDENLNVVRVKTAAYLEVREHAFKEVEDVLATLMKKPTSFKPEDVSSASVKVLKKIIVENGLTYQDCVEKSDLQKRAYEALGSSTDQNTSKRQCLATATSCERCDSDSDRGDGKPPLPVKPSVTPLAKLASVGVEELDRQHDVCAAALKELVAKRDAKSLKSLIAAYADHFEYEEMLLEKYLWTKGAKEHKSDSFDSNTNMRRSHFADHSRLLAELHGAVCSTEHQKLSDEFVNSVLRNFETHTSRYDNSYADKLSAAMES